MTCTSTTSCRGLPATWSVTDTNIAVYDAKIGRVGGRKAGKTKLEFKYPTLPATVWTAHRAVTDQAAMRPRRVSRG